MDENWVRAKAKELNKVKNDLYSGYISGREYQDKEKAIKEEVRGKYGVKGILLFNKFYKQYVKEGFILNV